MLAPGTNSQLPRTEEGIRPGSPAKNPSSIQTAIVDGDARDRSTLETLLRKHPAVTVAESGSHKAQELYDGIHLLFVDPEPDHRSCFEWLSQRPPDTEVIITTRSSEFAAQAFEIDAFAYLRKPVDPARLNHAIRRLLRLDWSAAAATPDAERIFVAFERGRRMVAFDEIAAIRAFGNYTQVLLANGKTEIVMKPLRRWEETLPSTRFVRIHRSTLVNVNRIRELTPSEPSDSFVLRVDGLNDLLPVSRRLLHLVRRQLAQPRPAVNMHRPIGPRP